MGSVVSLKQPDKSRVSRNDMVLMLVGSSTRFEQSLKLKNLRFERAPIDL
jgi:hypothetical protein